jgi:hypothetical protein
VIALLVDITTESKHAWPRVQRTHGGSEKLITSGVARVRVKLAGWTLIIRVIQGCEVVN